MLRDTRRRSQVSAVSCSDRQATQTHQTSRETHSLFVAVRSLRLSVLMAKDTWAPEEHPSITYNRIMTHMATQRSYSLTPKSRLKP